MSLSGFGYTKSEWQEGMKKGCYCPQKIPEKLGWQHRQGYRTGDCAGKKQRVSLLRCPKGSWQGYTVTNQDRLQAPWGAGWTIALATQRREQPKSCVFSLFLGYTGMATPQVGVRDWCLKGQDYRPGRRRKRAKRPKSQKCVCPENNPELTQRPLNQSGS